MQPAAARLTLRRVIADVGEAYRDHWRVLLLAGLVVFVPLGLLDVGAEHLSEPLVDGETELDGGTIAALIAAIIGITVGALIGEVIYTGIVSAVVVDKREGVRRPLRQILRHVPLVRLMCIDLLWTLVVVIGFILFLVPGFAFLAWFALVAPAAEIEDRGVRDSFRRSRELVRRRFGLVFAVVVGLLFAEDLLSRAAESVSLWGAGEGLVEEWLAAVLTDLLVSPLYALAAVVIFLRLRD